MSPTMWTGASSSRSIGCWRNTSLTTRQSWRIWFSGMTGCCYVRKSVEDVLFIYWKSGWKVISCSQERQEENTTYVELIMNSNCHCIHNEMAETRSSSKKRYSMCVTLPNNRKKRCHISRYHFPSPSNYSGVEWYVGPTTATTVLFWSFMRRQFRGLCSTCSCFTLMSCALYSTMYYVHDPCAAAIIVVMPWNATIVRKCPQSWTEIKAQK